MHVQKDSKRRWFLCSKYIFTIKKEDSLTMINIKERGLEEEEEKIRQA
jgi:hypothetical protein